MNIDKKILKATDAIFSLAELGLDTCSSRIVEVACSIPNTQIIKVGFNVIRPLDHTIKFVTEETTVADSNSEYTKYKISLIITDDEKQSTKHKDVLETSDQEDFTNVKNFIFTTLNTKDHKALDKIIKLLHFELLREETLKSLRDFTTYTDPKYITEVEYKCILEEIADLLNSEKDKSIEADFETIRYKINNLEILFGKHESENTIQTIQQLKNINQKLKSYNLLKSDTSTVNHDKPTEEFSTKATNENENACQNSELHQTQTLNSTNLVNTASTSSDSGNKLKSDALIGTNEEFSEKINSRKEQIIALIEEVRQEKMKMSEEERQYINTACTKSIRKILRAMRDYGHKIEDRDLALIACLKSTPNITLDDLQDVEELINSTLQDIIEKRSYKELSPLKKEIIALIGQVIAERTKMNTKQNSVMDLVVIGCIKKTKAPYAKCSGVSSKDMDNNLIQGLKSNLNITPANLQYVKEQLESKLQDIKKEEFNNAKKELDIPLLALTTKKLFNFELELEENVSRYTQKIREFEFTDENYKKLEKTILDICKEDLTSEEQPFCDSTDNISELIEIDSMDETIEIYKVKIVNNISDFNSKLMGGTITSEEHNSIVKKIISCLKIESVEAKNLAIPIENLKLTMANLLRLHKAFKMTQEEISKIEKASKESQQLKKTEAALENQESSNIETVQQVAAPSTSSQKTTQHKQISKVVNTQEFSKEDMYKIASCHELIKEESGKISQAPTEQHVFTPSTSSQKATQHQELNKVAQTSETSNEEQFEESRTKLLDFILSGDVTKNKSLLSRLAEELKLDDNNNINNISIAILDLKYNDNNRAKIEKCIKLKEEFGKISQAPTEQQRATPSTSSQAKQNQRFKKGLETEETLNTKKFGELKETLLQLLHNVPKSENNSFREDLLIMHKIMKKVAGILKSPLDDDFELYFDDTINLMKYSKENFALIEKFIKLITESIQKHQEETLVHLKSVIMMSIFKHSEEDSVISKFYDTGIVPRNECKIDRQHEELKRAITNIPHKDCTLQELSKNINKLSDCIRKVYDLKLEQLKEQLEKHEVLRLDKKRKFSSKKKTTSTPEFTLSSKIREISNNIEKIQNYVPSRYIFQLTDLISDAKFYNSIAELELLTFLYTRRDTENKCVIKEIAPILNFEYEFDHSYKTSTQKELDNLYKRIAHKISLLTNEDFDLDKITRCLQIIFNIELALLQAQFKKNEHNGGIANDDLLSTVEEGKAEPSYNRIIELRRLREAHSQEQPPSNVEQSTASISYGESLPSQQH